MSNPCPKLPLTLLDLPKMLSQVQDWMPTQDSNALQHFTNIIIKTIRSKCCQIEVINVCNFILSAPVCHRLLASLKVSVGPMLWVCDRCVMYGEEIF